MSKLGKILLYVALVGAIVAVVFGGLLVFGTGGFNETKANLVQVKAAKDADDKTIAKKTAENAALKDAKDLADKATADANTKIGDLNGQLATAQKQAADAQTAVQTANDAAKKAQDELADINKTLDGKTPQQYKDDVTKAQADLAASQAEQKILQDSLDADKTKIADLMDSINREKTGTQKPGISGKVTFVDRTWNFVVLDVGLSDGVVPNGELIVYRGRNFLGKVKITKVDANDSVAEILPDIKGSIEIGDAVLN